MGVYEAMQRIGKVGNRGSGSSGGFSASRYFQRNEMSAKSYLGPAAGQGAAEKQPLDVRRPYSSVGKASINLFGNQPVTPKSPELTEMPGAFEGTPFGPVAGALGHLGNIPLPLEWIPMGIGAGISAQRQLAKGIAESTPDAYTAWAAAEAQRQGDPTNQDWFQNTRMMVDFARMHAQKTGQTSELWGSMMFSPYDDNLGGLAQAVMLGLSAGSQIVQRGAAGTGNRVEDLLKATDEDLENKEDLIAIRDARAAGEIDDNTTLDRLTLAGAAISNPLGQAEWTKSIRGAGKGTPFQLPTEIAANLAAGAVSLGLEVVTDPASLLSLGAGTGARLAAKGSAKVVVEVGQAAGKRAVSEAIDRGVDLATKTGKTSALEDEIFKTAADKANRELYSYIPEGVAYTDQNAVRYALKAGDNSVREAMHAAGILKRPFVANQHVLKWMQMTENALDPLSLFGSDLMGRAGTKATSMHIINGSTDALGKRSVGRVMSGLEKIGIDQTRSGGVLGTALANIGSQIGGEQLVRNNLRLGIGQDSLSSVALTDLGQDMLARHGRDVESMAKHKVAKIALHIQPRPDETMKMALARVRQSTADDLVRMFDVSPEQALSATKRMGEKELGVVHMMRYGMMADDLLTARMQSIQNPGTTGLSADFFNKVIFLGPTQLTVNKAVDLRALIANKDYIAIREMVEQYDLLEWNISLRQSDEDLANAVTRLLDAHQEFLPTSITPNQLSPAMEAFKAKYGDSVELALRRSDVYASGRNADGKVVSADPFMDYIRGEQVGLGDVSPENIVKQHLSRLTNSISGQQVVIEQNRRFAQYMGQLGLTREQSEAVMSVVRATANEMEVASARGLSQQQLYTAAFKAIPTNLRGKIGSREVQLGIFYAHEGSLAKVGLSQKFTGMLKRAEVAGPTKSNVLGTISERYYPLVRFKWNAFFQLQEGIETPVLLVARGMISPSQFSGPLTGVRAGVRSAITEGKGGRKEAFRRGRQESSEAKRNIDIQTAIMMDAHVSGIHYAGDMIEAQNSVRSGSAAAGAMASGDAGRALTALLSDSKIARIKTRGQLLAYRSQVGNNMARMLKHESPLSWATARAFYADGGKLNDGDIAVRWFNDFLVRNDPDGAFSAVSAHKVEPGQFFRPSFLGRRTRWSEQVVMYALRGELDEASQNISFAQLRQRYLDPADPTINERWLDETLRGMGADEVYIQRTKWRMDYPTEAEWETFVRDELLGGDAVEAKAHMDGMRAGAAQQNLPLIEYLADQYAGHPQVLDENGVWKDTTLFQLIADAMEARGLATVAADHPDVVIGGTFSQMGGVNMPDIGLPATVGQLTWETHRLAPHTELVPLATLKDLKVGNELRLTPKELNKLARDLKSNGMDVPIQLTYSKVTRTVVIDEGNHRVAGLIQLLQERPTALKGVNVPVTVFTGDYPTLGGSPVRGIDPDVNGWVSQNLRPSDIGIGNVESAAILRQEAAFRREADVKDLTDGQRKGREYQLARASRVANPLLGTPDFISGAKGGRLVAKAPNGEVMHRIGGTKNMDEWVEELRANMTDEEMAEHAGWYVDMRRAFLALSDGDQQEAVTLLMAFGVTQMNTSPVDGMKYMLRVSEAFRARREKGVDLPEDIVQLKKVAGLNGENLKGFMETGYISEAGMGQKLIDFVDSLIGTNGRTVPVRGPDGKWTAVAGDVWAKRDVGFVDGKMYNHLVYRYGSQYDIKKIGSKLVKDRDTGEMEEVATGGFMFHDRATKESFHVPVGQSQPSSLEYDHIVEFYNNAADHLNRMDEGAGFLGRNTWVAAEAQALGWFKAKKTFNDATGDPRSAFVDSVYQTRVDVIPSGTAVMAAMYPEVAEHTSDSIAGLTGHQFSDMAARASGVRVITSHGSYVRYPDGRLGSATNFEVMASPDGIRQYLAALGAVSHQARVRATRRTVAKPTKANGNRHMVELTFPPAMPMDEMHAIHKALARGESIGEGDIRPTGRVAATTDFFTDSDIIVRADGTYAIRVIAAPGENLAKFTARMTDDDLMSWRTAVYNDAGHARGRILNPDEPMATGVREQAMRDKGEATLAASLRDPAPIEWADANIEQLADDLWQAIQPDQKGGWGGLTVNLHDGSRPVGYGAEKGGGPYATGITPKGHTASMKLDVTEAEFKQQVRDFVQTHRGDLQRPNAGIGVFRDIDPDHMRIDLDVNLTVETAEAVEGVQLVLGREGGAYDFTTEQSVYSPQFDPRRANDIDRGFAEVIEMENDWSANPNGEGYTAEMRKPLKFAERTPEVKAALKRVKAAGDIDQALVGWNPDVEEGFRRSGDLKVPERAGTVYRKQKGVLMAYDDEGNLVGQLLYTAEPGSYGVMNVLTKTPRQGVATRLYDEALAIEGDEFLKAIGQTRMTTSGKKFASKWLNRQAQDITEYRRTNLERTAGELEREGVQRGRMVWEDAYQRVAAREVAAHRTGRVAAGDASFDVGTPGGYLESRPRGTRAGLVAVGDSRHERRALLQRPAGGGAPAGAITDAGAALSTSAPGRPRRAQLYINPKRRQGDTLAHEEAHDWINRHLHESGRRRAKAAYAGREGAYPTRTHSRSHVLTVDEQEWLADQLVEYLRLGPDAVKHPALVPLAAHYSKTLKDKKIRVEPDLRKYSDEERLYQEDLAAYNARKAKHDAERQRQLTPEQPAEAAPVEGLAEATVQRDAVRATHTKWDNAGARNGQRMEGDLVKLEQQGVDVTDELNLLDEYNSMERGDFDSGEEFRDARAEAWDELLYSLDAKAQGYLEDLGLEEALPAAPVEAVPPVDIGEFAEVAPTAPTKPRATTTTQTLNPELKDLFDSIDRSAAPVNGHGFDVDEENILKWMYAAHRRADRSSRDLVHFKGERSWLERSLNHPYFGLYPLSYMWGKVLPEMVEFLAARPFGAKTPLVGYILVNKMYQHTMNAMENDPDLRSWMAENEDALRAISMLVPGVPWDLPVNSPLWLRRYVEGVATNLEKDMNGEMPEEYGAWEAFLTDIDYERIVGDTLSYTAGPAKGAETLLSYPGLVGKLAGGMQPTEEEELARNPDFIPPIRNREPQAQQPAAMQEAPPPRMQEDARDVAPESIQELEAVLGDEYEEVVERISGGG